MMTRRGVWIVVWLISVLNVVSSGTGGVSSNVHVCDTTTMAPVTIVIESNNSYFLDDCSVAVRMTANEPFLQNVAVISRGGNVAPNVVVNSNTIQNLTILVSDTTIVDGSASSLSPMIQAGGNLVTAYNIRVDLMNVHADGVVVSRLVQVTATQSITGLYISMVNCSWNRVSTGGLVAVGKSSGGAPSVTDVSVTIVGGTFRRMQFVPSLAEDFGSCMFVQMKWLADVRGAVIVIRDVVMDFIPGGDLIDSAALLVSIGQADNAVGVNVTIEDVQVMGLLNASIGSALSGVDFGRIVSFLNSSVSISACHITLQGGTVKGVWLSNHDVVENVSVNVSGTTWMLLANELSRNATGGSNPDGVIAAVVGTQSTALMRRWLISFTECHVIILTSNTTKPQGFASLTASTVMISSTTSTVDCSILLSRITLNVTSRQATAGIGLMSSGFSMETFSLSIGVFGAVRTALVNTTIVVNQTTLTVDVVVTPPTVTAVALLKANSVSVGLVNSNSNWTGCGIYVDASRVLVQQLVIALAPGVPYRAGEFSDCSTLYLVNTTALVSFRTDVGYFQACLPSPFRSVPAVNAFVNSIALSTIVIQTTLAVTNSAIVVSSNGVSIRSSRTPLFGAVVFLPAGLVSGGRIVSNSNSMTFATTTSSPQLPVTGSIIALSGTHCVAVAVDLRHVHGFPSGLLSSVEIQSTVTGKSELFADTVSIDGPPLSGNLTVSSLELTLRNCEMHPQQQEGFFGDSGTRWMLSDSTTVTLQACNTWNDRPLTTSLMRNLLLASEKPMSSGSVVLPNAVVVHAKDDACVVTTTLPLIPPSSVTGVSTTTVAVAMFSITLTAVAAAPLSSLTSAVRLQTSFGILRVARACGAPQQTTDSSGEAGSDDPIGSALFDNPLQLSLPTVTVSIQLAAGCVVGNTLLIAIGICILNTRLSSLKALSSLQGCKALIYHVIDNAPGSGGLGVLLLMLVPTVTSSVAIMVPSPLTTKLVGTVCVLCYVVGCALTVGVLLVFFPLVASRKRRRYGSLNNATKNIWEWFFGEPWEWVVARRGCGSRCEQEAFFDGKSFLRRYGALFSGYRGDTCAGWPCHRYAAVDVTAPIVCGILCGLPDAASSSSCSLLLWGLLGVSVLTCLGAVGVRPCITRWDNGWAMISNTLCVVVSALSVANDSNAANIVAAALAWMSLAPSLMQVLLKINSLKSHVNWTSPEPLVGSLSTPKTTNHVIQSRKKQSGTAVKTNRLHHSETTLRHDVERLPRADILPMDALVMLLTQICRVEQENLTSSF